MDIQDSTDFRHTTNSRLCAFCLMPIADGAAHYCLYYGSDYHAGAHLERIAAALERIATVLEKQST